jgi:2-oxoglutarate ferredoxin oxidoreductase subunit alpha
VPIVAPRTPSHCFQTAIEAVRIAVTYRTPVIVLSDGYLANGAEPWQLPDLEALPAIEPNFASAPNHVAPDGSPAFLPYIRDPDTLARPWAPPGVPGLEHRIGGLEKADETGNVSYDPENHEAMVKWRAAKVAGIAKAIPDIVVDHEDGADLLVLGWGSTYGAITAGVRRIRARGLTVAQAHLDYLNPFPLNLGEVVRRYPKVLIPEINLGQLSRMIRAEFLVDAQSLNKTQGVPFRAGEIEEAILKLLGGSA